MSQLIAFEPKRPNLAEVGLQIQVKTLFKQHKQRMSSRTIKALLRQAGFKSEGTKFAV